MRKLGIFTLFMLLLFSMPAFAAEKEISTKGMYIAGASESLNDAKQNALQDAMRQAAEQAGVLVSSFSKTHNMILTDDEVTVVATKIIQVKNKKFEVELLSDSEIKVVAYVDVVVNTDNINEDIIALKNKSDKLEKEKNKLQSDLQTQKNSIVNIENLTREIREKYNINESYVQEKELFTNSSWLDFFSNFFIAMDNHDYSGACTYSYGAILKFRQYRISTGDTPLQQIKNGLMDDELLIICTTLVEAYIADKDYQAALGYANFIKKQMEGRDNLNEENVNKLNHYIKSLEDYFFIYKPGIIEISRKNPREIWKI